MPSSDKAEDSIERSRLPKVVRLGNLGMLVTPIGLMVGGGFITIADFIRPGFQGNRIPQWLWPILVVTWTPGLLGLLASVYSVAMREAAAFRAARLARIACTTK